MSRGHYSIETVISASALTDFPKTLPPPMQKERVVFTMYGRNALFLGLQSLSECTTKRKILLPALNCGVEINVIRAGGFEVDFYNVSSSDLQCSLQEVKDKLDEDIAAVLVTHYFGFPQLCVPTLTEVCRDYGIAVIEDCAHALGSSLAGQALGTFGDFSIFSIRKSLPLPHGGALILNNPTLPTPEPVTPSIDAIDFDLLIYSVQRAGIVKTGVQIDAIYESFGKKIDPFGPRLEEYGGYKLGLPASTKVLIDALDVRSHLSLRRSVFNRYGAYFRETQTETMRALFLNCSEEVCPPFFPVVVNMNSEECHKLLSLKGERAPVPFWSMNPAEQSQNYGDILKLKQRLMILPLADPLEQPELQANVRIIESSL